MSDLHNTVIEFKSAIQTLYDERQAVDPSLDRLEQDIITSATLLKQAKPHMEKSQYNEVKKSVTDVHMFLEAAYGNSSPAAISAIDELFDLVGNIH